MPPAVVDRTLYRAILRWAALAQTIPFDIRRSHIQEVLPASTFKLLQSAAASFKDAAGVKALAQVGFRDSAVLEGPAAQEATERGFQALRLLNNSYLPELEERQRLRRLHSHRDGINHAVGQVVYHKKHRYRGVIYGWDRNCQRDIEWARQVEVEHGQPFYRILPDELDCQRLFGSPRSNKYVAQDSLQPIGTERSSKIVHRTLLNFFTGYSPSANRYLPNQHLEYEYPKDLPDEDLESEPCASHSNLLLHEEVLAPGSAQAGQDRKVVRVEILRDNPP